MLHLELMTHDADISELCPTWKLGAEKPKKLLDPTDWLQHAERNY
jgi:hypothetical protein